jgi:hypothetical protein
MEELEKNYQKALYYIQKGPKIETITNKMKLDFYGLFKQVTSGGKNNKLFLINL